MAEGGEKITWFLLHGKASVASTNCQPCSWCHMIGTVPPVTQPSSTKMAAPPCTVVTRGANARSLREGYDTRRMCLSLIMYQPLHAFRGEKGEGQERDTGPDELSDRQKEREEGARVGPCNMDKHCTRETGPGGEQAGQVMAHACPGKLVELTSGWAERKIRWPGSWLRGGRVSTKECVSQMTELKYTPSHSRARLEMPTRAAFGDWEPRTHVRISREVGLVDQCLITCVFF